jgi:hypothetical protein
LRFNGSTNHHWTSYNGIIASSIYKSDGKSLLGNQI